MIRRSTPSRSRCSRRCSPSCGVRDVRLRLSSLGSLQSSAASTASDCRHICAPTRTSLSEEVRARIELNPLRAFDSDHPGTRSA